MRGSVKSGNSVSAGLYWTPEAHVIIIEPPIPRFVFLFIGKGRLLWRLLAGLPRAVGVPRGSTTSFKRCVPSSSVLNAGFQPAAKVLSLLAPH